MHRRRLGLSLAILIIAALVAIKPITGSLKLSLDLPRAGETAQAEAALEVGAFAVSILVNAAR